MDDYFCQGETEETVYDRLFFYHALLKTHSNKEHDNAKLHPLNPESTEELVEQIIYSVSVLILSNWKCIPHVYLSMAELLEEILDLHPLLLFVW